jgi:ABC-2 type transport system ATP-binding protein
MIDVKNLSRSYGEFLAVDRVSFDIASGEIVGLLGHNGAGKTTIMKMLSGYLEPTAGTVHIDGIALADDPAAVQQRLGYLPENLPVYPDMMVADYLDYAATLKGLEGDARTREVKRAISDTELGEKMLDPIATLSRGYKQRVGVAQALLGSPKVLILDEPTNGLDPNQTQHMRDLIQGLAKTATVILSTHIMQELDAICDRVLILRNGRLALDQRLAELRTTGHLRLRTDLPVGRVRELLPRHNIEQHRDELRLTLATGEDIDAVSAEVASAVAAEGKLYRLTPETRDLETVFRQVSVEGIDHAA